MFKCGECESLQGPRVSPIRVVKEQRAKVYPKRYNRSGEVIDNGGTGKEIVKEVDLCAKCAII